MIKKAPGGRRKFRAEYLTLSESELCIGGVDDKGEKQREEKGDVKGTRRKKSGAR